MIKKVPMNYWRLNEQTLLIFSSISTNYFFLSKLETTIEAHYYKRLYNSSTIGWHISSNILPANGLDK